MLATVSFFALGVFSVMSESFPIKCANCPWVGDDLTESGEDECSLTSIDRDLGKSQGRDGEGRWNGAKLRR